MPHNPTPPLSGDAESRPERTGYPPPVSDEQLRYHTIQCLTGVMNYFAQDADMSRFWPSVCLTLKNLICDLEKKRLDPDYQSRDFPTLNYPFRPH